MNLLLATSSTSSLIYLRSPTLRLIHYVPPKFCLVLQQKLSSIPTTQKKQQQQQFGNANFDQRGGQRHGKFKMSSTEHSKERGKKPINAKKIINKMEFSKPNVNDDMDSSNDAVPAPAADPALKQSLNQEYAAVSPKREDAFDLSPAQYQVNRKTHLAKLQMHLGRVGGGAKGCLMGAAAGADAAGTLHNYFVSYYSPELRFEDVDKYVQLENYKKRMKEEQGNEKIKSTEEKLKAKAEEAVKNNYSIIETFRHALEMQKREDVEIYEFLKQKEKANENEDLAIERMKKESQFVAGLNTFEYDSRSNSGSGYHDHPFQIRWEFYCQAYRDWQNRLNKFYPEIMGKSTRMNGLIVSTFLALVLYYGIQSFFINVYLKYNLIIRYQLFVTAAILAYSGGILWGYGISQHFMPLRLKKYGCMALMGMGGGGALALWLATFDFNLGYLMMNMNCLFSIAGIYWMRHRGLTQSWHVTWLVPLLCICIILMLNGQYTANKLRKSAEASIEEADLGDHMDISAIVKLISPKWIKEKVISFEAEEVKDAEKQVKN